MTSDISRHTYTAETDLGTDLSLTRGSVTLDASAIPHVTGEVTLAVEDPMILDELDPRDGRRIVVGATRDGHYDGIYSPWAEERRNLFSTPNFASGWAYVNATAVVAGGVSEITVGATPPSSNFVTPIQAFGFSAGERLSAGYEVENVGTTPVTLRIAVWNNTSYVYGAAVVIPTGERKRVLIEDLPYTSGGTLQVRLHAVSVLAGAKIRLSQPLAEKSASLGDYFDGGTNPTGDLERTRWLGTANASASVLEARTLLGQEWVPESFRYFDLGIREVRPDRAAGTVTVRTASDEAILSDFAQLVDDTTPRSLETSIRAICNYVLGKIGAALEPGTVDADVTAYWEVTNLLANPGAEDATLTNWVAGTGASALARTALPRSGAWAAQFTAAAGMANVVPAASSTDRFAVRPGEWYVFSFWGRSSAPTTMRAAIQWWTQNGTVLSSTRLGEAFTSSTTAYDRHYYVIAQAPPGVTHAFPYVNTTGNTAGRLHRVDDAMFYEGDEVIGYFDGSTTLAGYTTEWQDAANKSASTRRPLVERRPEALVWKAGTSAMAFLQPLLMSVGLRLVCDEQRRWTLRLADYRDGGSQSWRYGVNIETADENLSREDDSWFDAAVYTYTWTDSSGMEQTRVDSYSLIPEPTKVLLVELDTPFPGAGRAENVVLRAQGKGRTVSVSGIPSWTERTDQDLFILLEGSPIQTGLASKVRFDFDTDTVTVTSRTTDTPFGAIDLLTGTIDALAGTINSL